MPPQAAGAHPYRKGACMDFSEFTGGPARYRYGGGDDDECRRRPRILLVEDDAETRGLLRQLLARAGYDVTSVAGFEQALCTAERESFDLLIADVVLPDGCGWTLFEVLRERWPSLPGIVISAHILPEHVARSLAAGFWAHVPKPTDFTRLKVEIRRCLLGRLAANN